jgi:glycosyltransferase involved in cell wall biosynthesis
MSPKISIITPSFNQAEFIEATILSVLEQQGVDLEYIIIDGGSTDGSVEIIEKYADRLAYWISEPDQGQTEAINKGFARAQGDIIAWLNSDDTYQPGALAEAVGYLAEHPELGLVYGDARFIDTQGKTIGRFKARPTDYQKLRRGAVYIPQQSAFFRRAIWEQVGPLDPGFYFAMDYDLWVRIARTAPIHYLPGRHWANFRLHGAAKSIADDDRCWPEMIRVHRRDGGSWLSVITARYLLRKLLAPIVMYRRRKLFNS